MYIHTFHWYKWQESHLISQILITTSQAMQHTYIHAYTYTDTSDRSQFDFWIIMLTQYIIGNCIYLQVHNIHVHAFMDMKGFIFPENLRNSVSMYYIIGNCTYIHVHAFVHMTEVKLIAEIEFWCTILQATARELLFWRASCQRIPLRSWLGALVCVCVSTCA